jgi:hypothetical protein
MNADEIKALVERLRDPDAPFACASVLDNLTEDAAMALETLLAENQRIRLEFRADCEKQAEELFAVHRDASRYRWLRSYFVSNDESWDDRIIAASESEASVDAAIDTARSQSEEGGRD